MGQGEVSPWHWLGQTTRPPGRMRAVGDCERAAGHGAEGQPPASPAVPSQAPEAADFSRLRPESFRCTNDPFPESEGQRVPISQGPQVITSCTRGHQASPPSLTATLGVQKEEEKASQETKFIYIKF